MLDSRTCFRHILPTDYYLLFNQGMRPINRTLSFAGSGKPAELDSWTGDILPLELYEQVGGVIRIPVTLGANDVKLIAIGRPAGLKSDSENHAVATDGYMVRRDGVGLMLRADHAGEFQTRFSNGKVVETRVEALAAPMGLDRWTLGIESWGADGTGLPGLEHTQRQRLPDVTVKAGADHSLPGWSALGHPDKAGRGFYATDVRLPASWSKQDGAWLDLGQVVDTFRVTVNGTMVSPSSYQDTSRIDIGRYLRSGANRIEVRVATPLRNAVEAATNEGAKPLSQVGLIGPVILRPYRDVPLN